MKRLFCGMLVFLVLPAANLCRADMFGSGANAFNIEFVTIGEPDNPADTTGDPNPAGSVPYAYRMGKYEISEQMIDKANALGGVGITKDTRGPDKPATSVSWFEAAQFVNWLNTSSGSVPAYKFDANGEFQLWAPIDPGYNPHNLFRNTQARYFLPSADEWYKAAFYGLTTSTWFDFPNGNNTAPTPVASGTAPGTAVFDQPFEQGPADIMLAGGPSPFGTIGQAGNVWEWEETDLLLANNVNSYIRGIRGGGWYHDASGQVSTFRTLLAPADENVYMGFRVASLAIPEPLSLWLMTCGIAAIWLYRRRR